MFCLPHPHTNTHAGFLHRAIALATSSEARWWVSAPSITLAQPYNSRRLTTLSKTATSPAPPLPTTANSMRSERKQLKVVWSSPPPGRARKTRARKERPGAYLSIQEGRFKIILDATGHSQVFFGVCTGRGGGRSQVKQKPSFYNEAGP